MVTIWLVSHSVFIFDTGYRTSLRALWKVKHGPANYTRVLTPRKMVEVASGKKRDFLEGHNKARGTERPWAAVEEVLENALVGMFERTDPMKAWELKKLGSTAWQSVGKLLRHFGRSDEPSPAVSEQTKVLIYNRIPKSGSSLLLELLYTLGGRLGYLVVRGKYHSYRHFTRNDRAGLGHFDDVRNYNDIKNRSWTLPRASGNQGSHCVRPAPALRQLHAAALSPSPALVHQHDEGPRGPPALQLFLQENRDLAT